MHGGSFAQYSLKKWFNRGGTGCLVDGLYYYTEKREGGGCHDFKHGARREGEEGSSL